MPDADALETGFTVHLPDTGEGTTLEQDAEWLVLETEEGRRRLKFHDYDEIYSVQGLYEHLFYEELRCDSPRTIRNLVADVLADRKLPADELTVLDVGAGNGMVGEELDELGAGTIVGVDIIEEAASATERDRPGVYDEYLVMDLTDPTPREDKTLSSAGFNCMTSVAALGFGDIPPAAFVRAYNYVEDGGLVAFTIKDKFVERTDRSGFSDLIDRMLTEGVMDTVVKHRYQHRLAASGEPLHYYAYVAGKNGDVPAGWEGAA